VREDDARSELGSEAEGSSPGSPTTAPISAAESVDTVEPKAGSTSVLAQEPAVDPALAAQPNAPGPKLLRELHGRDRWLRVLAMAFTLYHLVAMLVGGSVSGVRRALKPLVGFYADGLRMTNSWGMFARPPTVNHVVIEATLGDGSKKVLSTTRAGDRDAFERIRDVRIRKIQGKLGEPGDRAQLGHAFLDYHCRQARAQPGPQVLRVRAVGLVHELRDDENNVTRKPTELTLLTRSCRDPLPLNPKRPAFMERFKGQQRQPESRPVPGEGGDL